MLKKIRKSSSHISLVLIGAAALGVTLAGCSKQEMRRDVYASKQDCLADWGQTPQDCEPAYDRPTGNAANTHYYGRSYPYYGGSSGTSSPSRSGKTIGSSSVSRGGFGSSGHSSSG
jgi:uncharacterized protein YgiB involved in biofilm formation